MVELSFLKSGSKYICEFEVSSDFNLHIEREKGGYLFLYQRSSEGGNYDSVGDAKFAPQDLVVDYDCSALVYPKYIKIVSEVEPSYAAVTTDGEVTEIKSQSKEVEITSNGVTEIAPDAGFGYLSGVKVNVNVPQSGGGESGGGDTMEYMLFDENNMASVRAALYSFESKLSTGINLGNGEVPTILIGPSMYANQVSSQASTPVKIIAFSINPNAKFGLGALGGMTTIRESLSMSQEEWDALPHITKEEFYNLEA